MSQYCGDLADLREGYPTVHEDPRDGSCGSSGDYYCKKCAVVDGIVPCEGSYPMPPEFNSIRMIPCTICAMANGGCWGWSRGHRGDVNYAKNSNGIAPGSSGIEDILNNHSCDPWMAWELTDEEVVLGFIQNGLFQHYKWDDIIDIGEGLSRTRPVLPPSSYLSNNCLNDDGEVVTTDRYTEHWYWWKIIPFEVVLPKRLVKVLKELLSDYSESTTPKTNQKGHVSEYEDGSWEYFRETYIEPGHVVHVFIKTLEKVLELNKGKGLFSSTVLQYHKHRHSSISPEYNESDKIWLASCHDESIHFLVFGSGDLYPEGVNTVLKVFDRDIFGTTLQGIVRYDWDGGTQLKRDGHICINSLPGISPDGNNLLVRDDGREGIDIVWNTGNHISMYRDVYRMVAFGTSSDRIVDIDEDDVIMSDYYNEFEIRVSGMAVVAEERDAAAGSDEEYEEYEVESYEEEVVSVDIEKVVASLQELQTIVDDDVKGHVRENTYIQLQNKMRDIYLLIK
jgi:hypothetical protein